MTGPKPREERPNLSKNAKGAVVAVVVNGDERAVPQGLTVADLLAELSLKPGAVVVERNREILARDALPSTPLEDGDRIELVHFVGGG